MQNLSSKPHYPILDGLRGVAAIMVVVFHIFEAHAGGSRYAQIINHGYLAVDFFFLLSGFVIGYAYDDRWPAMSIGNFWKRRLVRLQPMVVMGMVIGVLFFYSHGGSLFPLVDSVPVWKVIGIMLIGCFMIPVPPAMDIRGWQEMYPLNGPGWSLFFEYIGNLLYSLFIRRFSNVMLSVWVAAAALLLIHLAVTEGDVVGGWAIEAKQIHIGFARMLFPFFAGLLLFRVVKPARLKGVFLWSSLLVILLLSLPRFGDEKHVWFNGLYESFAIIAMFPLIVWMGASGQLASRTSTAICNFLGKISYPIYITHYPIIYLYTAYVVDNKLTLQQALPAAVGTLVGAIALAYVCLRWYDEPVREWLGKRVLAK